MVFYVSVSTYLGWREKFSLMVWRYGNVNGYPKPNTWEWRVDIIMLYHSSFVTSRNCESKYSWWIYTVWILPPTYLNKWLDVIPASSWRWNNLQDFLYHHSCQQYIETVVVFRHDTLPNQQNPWSCHWGCIPCNSSLILELPFTFYPLYWSDSSAVIWIHLHIHRSSSI